MDWREFVETMSVVEQTLREDPGGVYGRMDFATRDRYRHVVEQIAKSSRAVRERGGAQGDPAGARRRAPARRQRRRRRSGRARRLLPDRQGPAAARTGGGDAPVRRRGRCSGSARRIPVAALSGRDRAADRGRSPRACCAKAHADGLRRLDAGAGRRSSLLLGTSQLAVALVNWLATLLVTPQPLPRMDFSKGIPPESRTLVVVPTMLTSAADIENLVEALEVRFLANRDDHLHFGLLTDFRDAREETLPEDEALLQLARNRIEALNEKYRAAARQRRRRRHLLPVPSPAPLESAGAALDGLRAQARQAGGPECAAARRRGATASRWSSATTAVLSSVQVRHHAGHRHAAAARRGAAVRRRDGASAEPPALRRSAAGGSA